MISVIIAGGSGTRLWPLSTSSYPKHLLALAGDKTMVQNTYARAAKMSSDVYVISEVSHAHHVREQLPEVDDEHFMIEPGRRGTANCILASLTHIAERHDPDEPIAFLFADHHIRDFKGFMRSFEIAETVSRQQGRIVLIGVEPTYPATGFGYIKRGREIDHNIATHTVDSFKEKPDFKTAKKYLASGDYLWNCGYFVGSVNTFLSEMKRSAPELKANYEQLVAANAAEYEKTYLSFKSQVIDIALSEQADDLIVVTANFDWMDLGSFQDLHGANDLNEQHNHLRGKGVVAHEVGNAYIRNEEDKPVVVIGLDNIVVVNTPNGLLVVRKDLSQKIGEIAKKIDQ
ncbi:MAG: mannose-1-phosphate guanylyltransferase [Candidatus Saccharimonadales bacterium]